MMPATKKRAVRPNRGSSLRPRAGAPRRNFLFMDVTEDEHKQIIEHCLENHVSVSQFLADLVLKDATQSKPKRKERVLIRAEFELTPDEQERLELLVRLHQKESVGEFLRDLLQPNLDLQRPHAGLETRPLRYYLSEGEHQTVTKHIASKGIAARNYGVRLALTAIAKARNKRK